jgi:hypothetical protein
MAHRVEDLLCGVSDPRSGARFRLIHTARIPAPTRCLLGVSRNTRSMIRARLDRVRGRLARTPYESSLAGNAH